MMLKTIATPLLLATALCAQAPMQFEVASIRPAEPIVAGSGAKVNIGVFIDRNQFRATSMSVKDYMGIAYTMRSYQIESPEWTASDRFDINATMPAIPDGTKMKDTDLASMMQGLLEDRFHLKTHRGSKDFPVYALVTLKDGIKAKESPLDATDGKSVTIGGTGTAQGTVVSLGRGSTLSVGGNHIEAKKFSMAVLADTLARFVDRPVVDQTGLTSTYDIDLVMTQEDFQALMIRSAVAAGVTLPPQALKLMENASGDSLHEALAKVGLKLEAKKAPLDVIFVDSINRTPSEN
jgi:uncharacterized protein (TIGR03435 family)